MWSDIETSKDLLGYSVHASLLKDVVTNTKNLPITIGLYGDWGSGKSSILKILQERLEAEDDCVVVYFDGWSFESFDDAKMALIQGIVDALEADERFFAKVGDKTSEAWKGLKNAFSKLRKSISWMRTLKVAAKTLIPIATAGVTGGASLIPLLIDAFQSNKEHLGEILTGDKAEKFLRDVITYDDDKKFEAVREFRTHFEELIDKSKQGKIVILIDDLDRCLPRHIIDNLEAIKLFLNVPKTAFVIAADEFIVANAIKSEYKEIIDASESEDRPNIGKSYMEKFIQLPYRIPKLSRKEVETYVTLLFCQSILSDVDFGAVQSDFSEFSINNKFDKYGWENIQCLLEHRLDETPDLQQMIGFVARFSNIIGQSLRWNPRLIKRFLNAYEIRTNLLAKSDICDQKNKLALLKLMLIEQQFTEQFKQLNTWSISTNGTPEELLAIERYAQGERKEELEYKDWKIDELLQIVSEEPLFSSVNMKELFWVSRDNMIVNMSGVTLIPSRIRQIFKEVIEGTDNIRVDVIKKKVSLLTNDDLRDFYNLLDTQISTAPNDRLGYTIYCLCDVNNIPDAFPRLTSILSRVGTSKIPMSLGNRFSELIKKYGKDGSFYNLISTNKKLIKAIETA